MSEPFIGEIRAVGFNYAPRDWAMCMGQLMEIQQNPSLYSLLGVTYGGDGRSTFALPDLRGRCLIGVGAGPGLTNRRQGERGGSEYTVLYTQNLPSHNHTFDSVKVRLNAYSGDGDLSDPTDAIFAHPKTEGKDSISVNSYSKSTSNVKMSENGSTIEGTISNTGENIPFYHMPPYLVINYIIALVGIYPPRS